MLIDAAYIMLFGVNVIYNDEWELVPTLDKLYTGTLGFADLFAQHNEHRIFFPRIVMLVLAYVTHYNTIVEMFASLAVMVCIIAIIYAIYRKRSGPWPASLIQFAPVIWLFFTLRQNGNLLWGWQIQIYLSILGFVAAIYFLEKAEHLNIYFVLSAFCGLVSSFSFMNGLLVWPVGLAYILLSRNRGRLRLSIIYSLIGAIVIAVFFYQWVYPPNPTSIVYAQNPVITFVEYVLINIGSAIAYEMGNAIGVGAILLLLLGLAVALAFKRDTIVENAPWLAFILFSLLSTASFAVGRSRLGIDQALTSRYTSFTIFMVIGLYLLVTDLYNKRNRYNDCLIGILYGMVVSIILLGIIVGYLGGIYVGDKVKGERVQMVDTLVQYRSLNDSTLSALYNTHVVRERAEILEKYRLSVFAGT